MAQISFNPMVTTTASGLFNVSSLGYTQGDAQPDPAVRFYLASGQFTGATPNDSIWGGVPITEYVSSDTGGFNAQIVSASSTIVPTGICVFNQAFNGLTTPQSTVPTYASGMSVNFYRFGSGARIPMLCDSTMQAIIGGAITVPVYYNYTTNKLTTTPQGVQPAFPVKDLKISISGNLSVSYDPVTGFATWATSDVLALCLI